MQNITKLPTLFKRDTTGKIRQWEVEYGEENGSAGTRTISGLTDGQKVISEWNLSTPKNGVKANETTSLSQAQAEAQAVWDKRSEKEYFENLLKTTRGNISQASRISGISRRHLYDKLKSLELL